MFFLGFFLTKNFIFVFWFFLLIFCFCYPVFVFVFVVFFYLSFFGMHAAYASDTIGFQWHKYEKFFAPLEKQCQIKKNNKNYKEIHLKYVPYLPHCQPVVLNPVMGTKSGSFQNKHKQRILVRFCFFLFFLFLYFVFCILFFYALSQFKKKKKHTITSNSFPHICIASSLIRAICVSATAAFTIDNTIVPTFYEITIFCTINDRVTGNTSIFVRLHVLQFTNSFFFNCILLFNFFLFF